MSVFQGNFVIAQDSKITVYSGTSDEAILRGLNKITLPLGHEMSTTTIQEFGRSVDLEVPSGAKYPPLAASGYLTVGDPTQVLLRQWSRESTEITHLRWWVDEDDFCALDLINDEDGVVLIGSVTPPSANKSGAFSFECNFHPVGTCILFDKHSGTSTIDGTDLAFAADAGSGATITSTSQNFETLGFTAGMTIIVDYATTSGNTGYKKIESVSAGVITLTDDYDLTSETGLATTKVHGGA